MLGLIWLVNLRFIEVMDVGFYLFGFYFEREGELDCFFYFRIGFCRFGLICRFNYFFNRKLVSVDGYFVNFRYYW